MRKEKGEKHYTQKNENVMWDFALRRSNHPILRLFEKNSVTDLIENLRKTQKDEDREKIVITEFCYVIAKC